MKTYLRRMTAAVLAECGVSGSSRYVIDYVDGFAAPEITSGPQSWHYETAGGRLIHHPSAYGQRGWSNMRYISATKGAITVGRGWAISAAM